MNFSWVLLAEVIAAFSIAISTYPLLPFVFSEFLYNRFSFLSDFVSRCYLSP